jgi:hypothetical protein
MILKIKKISKKNNIFSNKKLFLKTFYIRNLNKRFTGDSVKIKTSE